MTVETYLREVSLFRMLPAESLTALVKQGEVLEFAAEQVVCWEGEESDAMYVILNGSVRVFKQDDDGTEIDLNVQKQGECFGELALLDSQPRSATIVCLSPCRLFKLEKAAFMNLLLNPDTQSMALSILSVLVQRVRVLTEKYFDKQLAQRTLNAKMEAERHRSLAQMVAGVAHELNTPLGVVNTAVNMIEKRVQHDAITTMLNGDQTAQRILADMQEASVLAQRNIERAHKLVQNFKKISVSQLVADRETVDISALLLDILDLFKINARNAQLTIVVNDSLRYDQKDWTGYPGHLTQVLMNFLFNIERYAYPDQRGGMIHVGLASDNERTPPLFVLTVQDQGVGIPPENLPHVFDPFFTTGRSKGGTGLGLAIVHNMVTEALYGSIEVDSEMGKGTCFRVTFPQVID